MAIIQEIDRYQFVEAFKDYNRENNFSRLGREALYDYLWDLSEDIGENINLDVIAICCDFTEYNNLDEYLKDYSTDIDIDLYWDIDEKNKTKKLDYDRFYEDMEEEIRDRTELILIGDNLDEGFIIKSY